MPETLVFLHGFGGTRQTWDGVIAQIDPQRYRPLALDLPGHGELASYTRPITFESCVETVLAAAPERFALCGYSMGGRIALHLALAAGQRVSKLALVSCTAGIEDDAERSARRRADHALADELEQSPEDFIARWQEQPLFASDPEEVLEMARVGQRRNDPRALAAVLRGIGAGEMRPVWADLRDLQMPVTAIAGNRDIRYCRLAERISQSVRAGRFFKVPGGHRLPLESAPSLARKL